MFLPKRFQNAKLKNAKKISVILLSCCFIIYSGKSTLKSRFTCTIIFYKNFLATGYPSTTTKTTISRANSVPDKIISLKADKQAILSSTYMIRWKRPPQSEIAVLGYEIYSVKKNGSYYSDQKENTKVIEGPDKCFAVMSDIESNTRIYVSAFNEIGVGDAVYIEITLKTGETIEDGPVFTVITIGTLTAFFVGLLMITLLAVLTPLGIIYLFFASIKNPSPLIELDLSERAGTITIFNIYAKYQSNYNLINLYQLVRFYLFQN